MMQSLFNVLAGRPALCVYDVTTRCNSRCAMCSIWKRREKEMPLKDIKKVFSDLKRFGIHTLFLQGGEPLVRRDVFEVVKILDDMGFHTVVLSNGILLDEKVLKKLDSLNRSGRIFVTVSLDTLDRKKYIKIRGVDKFDVVTSNIRLLAKHPGLKGSVHATVTSINYNELDDVREFVHSLGLDFTFNSYNDTKNYASSGDKSLHLGNCMENVITEMSKVSQKLPPLYRPFIKDNIRYLRGEDVGRCDAFVHSFRLTSEGMLTPCLEFPPMFDLKKEDINRKWGEWSKKMACPVKRCYEKTPCFYGCTRGTGSIRKRPFAALNGLIYTLRR
ncbi:MAG: radical SAM protein [Candidatus Aenigmarchaeota archaeon]|nr:radical SAM protein [Candidatus Aenigmarchaeota archaeon]